MSVLVLRQLLLLYEVQAIEVPLKSDLLHVIPLFGTGVANLSHAARHLLASTLHRWCMNESASGACLHVSLPRAAMKPLCCPPHSPRPPLV